MRRFMRKDARGDEGFTLIELAVALAILGILVAIAVPTYMGVRNRAYDSEAKQALGEIRAIAWSHFLEQGGWTELNDDIHALGFTDDDATDKEYTTEHWEFTVEDGTDENSDPWLGICAQGDTAAGSPTSGRTWLLTLHDDGRADLQGPTATCP